MFLIYVTGLLVAFVHGADVCMLKKVIIEKIEKEMVATKDGKFTRNVLEIHEALPKSELEIEFKEMGEEKRKSNVKTLKNSIITKKILK